MNKTTTTYRHDLLHRLRLILPLRLNYTLIPITYLHASSSVGGLLHTTKFHPLLGNRFVNFLYCMHTTNFHLLLGKLLVHFLFCMLRFHNLLIHWLLGIMLLIHNCCQFLFGVLVIHFLPRHALPARSNYVPTGRIKDCPNGLPRASHCMHRKEKTRHTQHLSESYNPGRTIHTCPCV